MLALVLWPRASLPAGVSRSSGRWLRDLPAQTGVPANGLTPSEMVDAYDAAPLTDAGYDGSGQTIVFLEWAPPSPHDLEMFTSLERLAPLHPVLVGENGPSRFSDGPPGTGAVGEADLDVEVAHEIAPGARIVVYDANPSGAASSTAAPIVTLFDDVAKAYPGAIWSSSIGWGCDQAFTWDQLQPVEDALAAAESFGTSAFDAAGDTDGLECEQDLQAVDNQAFDTPPTQQDIGVDAIAALPSMTSVGGTTLSVTPSGSWFSEEAWDDSSITLGTGGGVSTIIPQPSWQQGPGVGAGLNSSDVGMREVPDVAADADPSTGATIVQGGQLAQGGGTSQAAPIWAALTALMDEYLEHHQGHAIGSMNPVLYALASTHQPYPPLHEVTLGGNAVHEAGVGYNMATGLGTPDTYNLVRDILRYQQVHG